MGRINVTFTIFEGPSGPNDARFTNDWSTVPWGFLKTASHQCSMSPQSLQTGPAILAEGAIALSVTHSGGALLAS